MINAETEKTVGSDPNIDPFLEIWYKAEVKTFIDEKKFSFLELTAFGDTCFVQGLEARIERLKLEKKYLYPHSFVHDSALKDAELQLKHANKDIKLKKSNPDYQNTIEPSLLFFRSLSNKMRPQIPKKKLGGADANDRETYHAAQVEIAASTMVSKAIRKELSNN